MEIRIQIEAAITIQEGETNINEFLWAIGNWSREIGLKVTERILETYQSRIVELLCAGQGRSSWITHEHKGMKGQMCIGGSYSGGGERENRVLRTELGNLSVRTQQIVCRTCGKRFRVLGPLLKIPARSKPTIRLKHMAAETMTDLSYRKGGSRMVALTHLELPKSTAHRWMTTENWQGLGEDVFSAETFKSFGGILADGTGYKRQGAETTKGDLRLVMGMTNSPRKLVPLGVWVDKSWEEIDQELLKKRPEGIQPPVVVMDGEKGQEVLGNLAQDIQRCQWHTSNQLGYFLWRDEVAKEDRDPCLQKLSGLLKIELPSGEYQAIPNELKEQIQGQLIESKQSLEKMIRTFQNKGYHAASSYLRNAAAHTFTIVEKWLELGYMPPKVISLLERVMREMGRRIKKIGASWKEKGLLSVAKVLMTRIYNPQQWKSYWEKLLDLQGRCAVKSYAVHCAVV